MMRVPGEKMSVPLQVDRHDTQWWVRRGDRNDTPGGKQGPLRFVGGESQFTHLHGASPPRACHEPSLPLLDASRAAACTVYAPLNRASQMGKARWHSDGVPCGDAISRWALVTDWTAFWGWVPDAHLLVRL